MTEWRTDQLSGQECLVPAWADKPLPAPVRRARPASGPCPLCALTAPVGPIGAGGRVVYQRHGGHAAVENRWPLIGGYSGAPGVGQLAGRTELVVAGTHVEGLGALDAVARTALGSLIEDRALGLAGEFPHLACFVTVGAEAGGSQPHLHAQVVGSELAHPAQRAEAAQHARLGRCPVEVDRAVAVAGGCSLGAAFGVAAWVAPAPAAGLELRFQPIGPGLGVPGVLAWTAWLDGALGYPAHNLVLHAEPALTPHWHLYVRTRALGSWELGYGVNLVTEPPEHLAARLLTHATCPGHPHPVVQG